MCARARRCCASPNAPLPPSTPILTLPAALTIRDAKVARMFREPQRHVRELLAAFEARLPEAEAYLDRVAEEAKEEAQLFSRDPRPLWGLVERTRELAGR
jgi:hypothetical protein